VTNKEHTMDVKILGTGCVNCKNLEALTRSALDALGLDVEIDKVTDPGEIASWGVMSTPALVIDDEVVAAGRIPSPDQLKELLLQAV
jgi:small redox-active disulfide protein 2